MAKVYNEVPTPVPDGINTVFTFVGPIAPGTLRLFRMGVRQTPVTDFTPALPGSNQVTFSGAPNPGDLLLGDYETS